MEDLWIPIVLVAAALQTARNAGQKHLSTQVSPWLAAWVRFGFGLPIALIYLAIVLAGFDLPFPPLTLKFLVPAGVAALMQIAGTVFLIRLFRLRNFAIGSTFVRTEAIIAAVLGSVVFAESIDLWGWLAIVISVTGVVLISVVRSTIRRTSLLASIFNASAGVGLLAGLGFALASFFIRQASLSFADDNVIYTAAVTFIVVIGLQTLVLGLFIGLFERWEFRKLLDVWRPSLFVGVTSAIGSIGWFTAMTMQRVSFVKALAQIEFVFALFVAILVFKERPTRVEMLGMVLIAIGIVVLLLFAR
ncbi:MAG: DMT family transporter [Arenicellales bacterium]|nr:DMT family transporter [Arenicellales bacterium]